MIANAVSIGQVDKWLSVVIGSPGKAAIAGQMLIARVVAMPIPANVNRMRVGLKLSTGNTDFSANFFGFIVGHFSWKTSP